MNLHVQCLLAQYEPRTRKSGETWVEGQSNAQEQQWKQK